MATRPVELEAAVERVPDYDSSGGSTEDAGGGVVPQAYAASAGSAASVSGIVGTANGGTGVTIAGANRVFAGPVSGADAAPAFRALVAADISFLGEADVLSAQITAPAATDLASAILLLNQIRDNLDELETNMQNVGLLGL